MSLSLFTKVLFGLVLSTSAFAGISYDGIPEATIKIHTNSGGGNPDTVNGTAQCKAQYAAALEKIRSKGYEVFEEQPCSANLYDVTGKIYFLVK